MRLGAKAKSLPAIEAIEMGEVPEARQRFRFLFVACEDITIRIFSLEPDSCLE